MTGRVNPFEGADEALNRAAFGDIEELPHPEAMEAALTTYHEAYHSVWRPGGDAGDHDEAHREGIAAVLALAPGDELASAVRQARWKLEDGFDPLSPVIVDGRSWDAICRKAEAWVDGKPRPPVPCPRCGETHERAA